MDSNSETAVDRANKIRQRILAGEDPTPEEMNTIIVAMIGERAMELAKAPVKKTKTKSETVDLGDLISDS